MNKIYKKSLFIFRRDIRLADNRAINAALEQSKEVLFLFIVDPKFNKIPQQKSFAKTFLFGALKLLSDQLKAKGKKLHFLYGQPESVLAEFIHSNEIQAVYFNKEYTASGIKRDEDIASLLNQQEIKHHTFDDAFLFPPAFILKADGTPYTVFTPFFKRTQQYSIEKTHTIAMLGKHSTADNFEFPANEIANVWHLSLENVDIKKNMNEVLDHIVDMRNYTNERDFPALSATSRLSTHLKFGTFSVREVYWHIYNTLGADHALLRQLYWRDFFGQIGFHFPHVFKNAFRKSYNLIKWQNNPEWFQAWCAGKTGFPIVDAGMRELNETGYMHNRVRMIVASFLVKDLHIDWRWGERYFAEKLIDYDVAVNNGNWQWAASTGCDAQPYFRIFNPWLQQNKFDKECAYIKNWVPELRVLNAKDIHHWSVSIKKTIGADNKYPLPIVDHKQQSDIVKQLFKNCDIGSNDLIQPLL